MNLVAHATIALDRLDNFESAGQAVLAYLHQRLGFKLWMLTRTEGDDWIVLHTEDHGYGVQAGQVFRWSESFCSRMVQGQGPRVAPDSRQVPAYCEATIARQVPIQAYVGVPLWGPDGQLFGTLCAIDPEVQPQQVSDEQALVELLAGLLSALLQQELRGQEATRRAEAFEALAMTDGLTQLYNRRGWETLLQAEELRCRRYGHSAAVIVLDLDKLKTVNDQQGHHAGDALILRAAQALSQTARTGDTVARLGGDEFALLCVECDAAGLAQVLQRLHQSLQQHGVEASVGAAVRDRGQDLQACWQMADARMYAEKRQRHGP